MTIKGQRVKLVKWEGTANLTLMKSNKKGTVAFIDDTGTVHVDWDDGGRLGLIPGIDLWEVIDDKNTAE